MAHASVTIAPADALVAVDGAPLLPGGPSRMVAGVRAAGPGEAAPAATFELVLDPGAHVFVLSHKGFGDVVVNRTFAPASTTTLKLELDKLPGGLMHIASDHDQALVVTVGGIDVGMAPVDVTRPAGSYQVLVEEGGLRAPTPRRSSSSPGDLR